MASTILIAAIVLGLSHGAGTAGAQDRLEDWRGRPSIEFTGPQFEQPSTLRVVRSSGNIPNTMDDQGSVLGWGKAAVDGKVKPREELTDPEGTIEVLRRSEAREAIQEK